ncbi:MAG: bifunctional lysylphosphatidylglycerol flippase/synthetase MprF [Hyphomonas sp.]|uniref:bifunctional lysylphosphatidylglycerol flippase/synthetase MprF n=1 Tax=Hyphomonas sp. TaxID=87 RepID=UPI003527DA53
MDTQEREPESDAPLWPGLAALFALAAFAAAIFAIHARLDHLAMHAVYRQFAVLALPAVLLAVAATCVSYAATTVKDALVLRHLGWPRAWREIAFPSFTANALGNSLGFPAATGGSIRSRIYTRLGLSATDSEAVASLSRRSLTAGALLLSGAGLVFEPAAFPVHFGLPDWLAILIGVVLLGLVGVHLRRSLEHPSGLGGALARLGVSLIDWAAAGLALFILLPQATDIGFAAFLPIFTLACLAGGVSGLPGGIGVFEAVILLLVPGAPIEALVASLIAFRAVYYLLPLVLAAAGLGLGALQAHTATLRGVSRGAGDVAGVFAPVLFGVLAFASGAYMLAAAMTPALPEPLKAAAHFLPLPVIEISHFLASIAGLFLLIVANGLSRRLAHAWAAASGLLVAGIILTLMKGAGISEALPLLAVLIVLALSRGAFYRDTPLGAARMTPAVTLAILATIGAAIWLGLFSYEHVEYRNELWWQVALQGGTSRFLRAAGGVSVLALLFFALTWLRPLRTPPTETAPSPAEIRAIVSNADTARPDAALALMGDKQFHFSPSRASFIMFGVRGRTWIAMGEPVGLAAEIPSLVWSFREAADAAGASIAFYGVGSGFLPLAVDLGLSVQKIGETAIIPLAEFSLDGPDRSRLRQSHRRAGRDGLSFDMLAPEDVPAHMEQLKAISDDWLAHHGGAEKGFSLGRFDPDYLAGFPIALARLNGEPIAFANIWPGAGRHEAAIDLMRFSRDAPHGVMEYLFTECLLWAKGEGYARFDLGMAPLSGLDAHRLAPALSRIGAFVFAHGSAVYGFEGLRAFKDKFRPAWEPLYLAAPTSGALPRVLADVALLTSGGLAQMFRK